MILFGNQSRHAQQVEFWDRKDGTAVLGVPLAVVEVDFVQNGVANGEINIGQVPRLFDCFELNGWGNELRPGPDRLSRQVEVLLSGAPVARPNALGLS